MVVTKSMLPDDLFFEEDGLSTETSKKQIECEQDVARFFKIYNTMPIRQQYLLRTSNIVNPETHEFRVYREKTTEYILQKSGLVSGALSANYTSLSSSRPWLMYWSIHALELLDGFKDGATRHAITQRCIRTLKSCQNKTGGFNGDVGMIAHTAPTYAAVLAIATLGTQEAYDIIDRPALYRWLMRMKDDVTNGFRVQEDGEIDTRGLYTVLAVASICNILTPELVAGTAEYIGSCQTFEGGLGGEPGNEAHGGYAFCALAALHILKRYDTVDFDHLCKWISARQMRCEGGFQGRTNKLVDSCYSFWQGSIPVLMRMLPFKNSETGKPKYSFDVKQEEVDEAKSTGEESPMISFGQSSLYEKFGVCLYDQIRLQQYVVLCCQFSEGGLRDKPSSNRDMYHTCYSLSGLSLAQNYGPLDENSKEHIPLVWGDSSNLLKQTDPVYNVEVNKLKKAMAYFATMKCSHEELMADGAN